METFGQLPFRQLTKLYSDTKQSCDIVAEQEKQPDTPEVSSVHRKLRIQKDRLIAWGIEWSDTAAAQGSIDESVAQAGLTETVTSVLGTIQDILNEAERIPTTDSSKQTPKSVEKGSPYTKPGQPWSAADGTRYDDLVKDLTSSIDILYDLSRARRAFHGGALQSSVVEKSSASRKTVPLFNTTESSVSELTLINPSTSSTLVEAESPESSFTPGKLDFADLVLPEEEPPPYFIGQVAKDTIVGAPPLIGHLSRPQPSTNPWRFDSNKSRHVPVLIEYAYFDSVYKDTGVPPPLDRLENFVRMLGRRHSSPSPLRNGILACLGYFEDPAQPRFGLVFELPSTVYNGPQDFRKKPDDLRPASLLTILQAGSRSISTPNPAPAASVPPLEDRFRLAYRLVSEFSRIHSEGFLHKEVNSSKIMLFRNQLPVSGRVRGAGFDLRSPFLASFDLFSEYNVDKLERNPQGLNIYRHPEDPRFIDSPSQSYNYQHDIYGVALMLIEIGLWLPLSDIFKSKYSLEDFRVRLEDIWVKRLISKCGTAYSHAVVDCLHFASDGLSETFNAARPPRSLYRKVLSRLQRCCLLDEADPVDEDMDEGFGTVSNRKPTSSPAKPSDLSSRLSDWQQMAKQNLTNLKRNPSKKKTPPPPPPTRQRKTVVSAPILGTPPNESNAVRRKGSSPNTTPRPTRTPKASSDGSSCRPGSPVPGDTGSSEVDLSLTSAAAAAKIIQRAWRTRRAKLSFEDYRRKIVIIQQRWRQSIAPSKNTESNVPSHGQSQTGAHRHLSGSERTATRPQQQGAAPRKKLRLQPLKIDQILLDEWHQNMLPRLEKLVGRAVRDSPETISIDLVAVGDSPIIARPTVFITCGSTARVKAVLERKFVYDTTVFDLKVRKGKIRRSKVGRSRTQRHLPARSMVNEDERELRVLNPFHQERPLCGASIGAFKGEHLPPVSYGGVVLVDDVPLGLTVHHMLDQASDDEGDGDEDEEVDQDSPIRSMATRQDPSLFAGIGASFNSAEPMPFEISDDSEDEEPDYDSLDDFSSDTDSDSGSEAASDASTCGDIDGIQAGEGDEIAITQPAIDDVNEDFWGNSEDRDEDHLDSHSLGHVHASSGIRRWEHKGILHEIDWALIQLKENRLQPFNLIQGGRRFAGDSTLDYTPELVEPVSRGGHYQPTEDEYPRRVAKSDTLGGLAVHCFGRTTGLQSGVVGQAMSAVRIYRRRSFSRSWHVLGSFGFGGDSGAWVVDNDHSRVCGHVLARSALVAYICPMETILLDIKRTTRASRIALPGAEDTPIGDEAPQMPMSRSLEASLRSLTISDIKRMSSANDNHHVARAQLDMGGSPTHFEIPPGLTSQVARS